MLGGGIGGLLGGVLSLALRGLWKALYAEKPQNLLWSPSAIGFVVLGACIGLMIALAQVFLREAWIRVEAGFRAGREMLLSKSETLIGRAEGCDIGLFGDPGVEPRHARILLQQGRYLLVDAGSNGGTYLNDNRITQPTPLRSGDLIRLGRNVLRFGERASAAPIDIRRMHHVSDHQLPALPATAPPARGAGGRSDSLSALQESLRGAGPRRLPSWPLLAPRRRPDLSPLRHGRRRRRRPPRRLRSIFANGRRSCDCSRPRCWP